MNTKINKQFLSRIFLLAVMNVLFSGYLFSDLNSFKNDRIIHFLFGSISVECSSNIILVMFKVIPIILFLSWVVNKYISELKDNFLYIFLRTNNRELCLKKNMVKIFISIFLYELFVMLIMLIFFIAPRESKEISVINLVVLLIINTLQLFMLAMISNMLVLFKSEVVCNLGNIILTTAPLVIVGALYEERKQWIIFAKWFPLNLGNYVYLNSMKENIISILLMIVINFVLYYATAYRLKKYELLE